MKKLSTDITTKKGEIKIITVEVDDMYADWLVTQPQEIEKAIADVKAVALLIKKFLQGNGFSYASRIFINSSPEMVSFS